MKYDNQLRYATQIIKDYDGKVPLSVWLKDYFRENKQMGSRDRKTVSEMVYGYYRLGNNQYTSIEERVIAYLNATRTLPEISDYFISKSIDPSPPDAGKIFPFARCLSNGIDAIEFSKSFLVQPDLFIRVRPGKMEHVISSLTSAGIPYQHCDDSCIRLHNSTKLDGVLLIDRDAVIQDKSSQRISTFLKESVISKKSGAISVWDCCAASGGKSILAKDVLGEVNITATDLRETIICNLRARLAAAGITHFNSFVIDLVNEENVPASQFDVVIADVPCSGSGTWARTPEQLFFFKEHVIDYYNKIQKKILSKVAAAMKPDGALLYITCSVFRKENEDVIEHAIKHCGLKLLVSGLIKGYNEKADTMFAAVFTRSEA
jgi:16S rRNA (cytosine967-C5)-methyltransferase